MGVEMARSPIRALTIFASTISVFAVSSALAEPENSAWRQLERLAPQDYQRPQPPPPTPVEIAVYSTDEEFTFESGAKEALNERLEAFRAAGLTSLGGRVTAKPNRRHTFAIDYIPSVEQGAPLPPAALLETYKSGAVYWLERQAEEAMRSCAANFRDAGLEVLGQSLLSAGRDHSFSVVFLVGNRLRPTSRYEVRFHLFVSGKFSFESGAEAALTDYTSRFKAAGIPVIRARAVKRPDRDYAVEIQYAVRTNSYGARPLYAIGRYDARETFSFEDGALQAAVSRLPAFHSAGAPAVHYFARKENRDYSFTVEYLVRHIHQGGTSSPSAVIKTYSAAETFDFESQAKTALEEKSAAFNNAGLPVIGAKVVPSGRDYTYVLDYIAKARPQHNP